MKKTAAFALLILLLACTKKEVPVPKFFDFELETSYTSEVLVNTPGTTEFIIVPEEETGTEKYEFKYVVSQGTGHFLDKGGNPLPEEQWSSLSELVFTFDYLPVTAGTHQVTVNIRNSSGAFEHSLDLTYEVANNGFVFIAMAATTDVNVETPIPVNFNLVQTDEGNVSYSMVFESTGSGTLEYGGEVYAQGEPVPLTPGESSGNYIGTTGGTHEVLFTVSNDNVPQVVKEDDISVVINNFVFEFSGVASDDSLFPGYVTNLNFGVNELEGESPVYEFRYVLNEGNAIIRDSEGAALSPEVYYPVNDPVPGFIFRAEAVAVGTVNVTFYIRNHIGREEAIALTLHVAQPSDVGIVTSVQQQNIYQQGGAGDICRIHYFSRVDFTATYTAGDGQLSFVSLNRADTGATVPLASHVLNEGQTFTYTNLADGVEYEVHYINPVSGEEITRTFVSEVAPPDQNIANCFPAG